MPKRTTKPTWAFERAFFNKGSLVGIITRLRNIAQSDSTLPDERVKLRSATILISQVLENWDNTGHKFMAQKLFNERQGR